MTSAPHDGDNSPEPQQPKADSNSEEVASTTAHLHFEGKGLDPQLEDRYDDAG